MNVSAPKRIIVAMTGASGAILGIRALEMLKQIQVETHLIISHNAAQTIATETGWTVEAVRDLAAVSYDPQNMSAQIASGSYMTDGMLVIPCSIKTLSAIANSYASNLIVRAADVCLKEGRPVLLAVRETPLHAGHLNLMSQAATAGAVIFPPVPAFYSKPQSLDDAVNDLVGRMLQRLGIKNDLFKPWQGL